MVWKPAVEQLLIFVTSVATPLLLPLLPLCRSPYN